MEKPKHTRRFRWTSHINRQAHLLATLGRSQIEIAETLGCNRSTVRKHLGNCLDAPSLSLSEMLEAFDQFDAARNVGEALLVRGGTPEQARLRASLRAVRSSLKIDGDHSPQDQEESLSDEQLCADLERLVGRPFTITD